MHLFCPFKNCMYVLVYKIFRRNFFISLRKMWYQFEVSCKLFIFFRIRDHMALSSNYFRSDMNDIDETRILVTKYSTTTF